MHQQQSQEVLEKNFPGQHVCFSPARPVPENLAANLKAFNEKFGGELEALNKKFLAEPLAFRVSGIGEEPNVEWEVKINHRSFVHSFCLWRTLTRDDGKWGELNIITFQEFGNRLTHILSVLNNPEEGFMHPDDCVERVLDRKDTPFHSSLISTANSTDIFQLMESLLEKVVSGEAARDHEAAVWKSHIINMCPR